MKMHNCIVFLRTLALAGAVLFVVATPRAANAQCILSPTCAIAGDGTPYCDYTNQLWGTQCFVDDGICNFYGCIPEVD
jgi:hypothetical protein